MWVHRGNGVTIAFMTHTQSRPTSPSIEFSPSEGPQAQTLWRGSKRDLDALRAYGGLYGRSLAEELRLAVRVHLRNHALGWAASERGEAEIRANGDEPAKVRREVQDGLGRICAVAYSPPEPEPLPLPTNGR